MHISQIALKSAPKGKILTCFICLSTQIQVFIFVQNAENAAL